MRNILLTLIFAAFIVNFSSGQKQTVQINNGSGMFTVPGGIGSENKSISVYYYKPKNFGKKSKVLLVIPGSGRNGDSYRDSWIATSEKHNVLILSPSYPEKDYVYEDYHLGGIIEETNTRESISFTQNSNHVFLDEDKVSITMNLDSKTWIFNDLDRIFDIAVKSLKTKQKKYDVFGHSAGGQILHRFAIFQTKSNADRIIAANAGSYTLTDFETSFPFGLKNTDMPIKDIKKSFTKKLTVFVGELDNADEKGGILLRSKTVDKQGLHRLARAKYFFKTARKKAASLGYKFNWELRIIPKVVHNQKKMARAAANYLYE